MALRVARPGRGSLGFLAQTVKYVLLRIFGGLGRALGKAAHILQVQVLPQKEKPAPLCSESCVPGGNKGGEA